MLSGTRLRKAEGVRSALGDCGVVGVHDLLRGTAVAGAGEVRQVAHVVQRQSTLVHLAPDRLGFLPPKGRSCSVRGSAVEERERERSGPASSSGDREEVRKERCPFPSTRLLLSERRRYLLRTQMHNHNHKARERDCSTSAHSRVPEC